MLSVVTCAGKVKRVSDKLILQYLLLLPSLPSPPVPVF